MIHKPASKLKGLWQGPGGKGLLLFFQGAVILALLINLGPDGSAGTADTGDANLFTYGTISGRVLTEGLDKVPPEFLPSEKPGASLLFTNLDYYVEVKVADNIAVSEVKTQFRTSGTTEWQELILTLSEGDHLEGTYRTELTAGMLEKPGVESRSTATDFSGNQAETEITETEVLFGITEGYSEDFSEETALWQYDGDWEWGSPSVGPSPLQGDNLMATKLRGNYSDNSESFLVSPPLDLRETSNPVIKLDHWFDLEEDYYDVAMVGVSSGDKHAVMHSFTGRDRQWRTDYINLEPFAGSEEQVFVYFMLFSDESVNYPGWYIDRVELIEAQIDGLYFSDFETDNGGWSALGDNCSWEWGAPADVGPARAYSGEKVWATNLTGNYLDNSLSWIEKTFDLRGLDNVYLDFYHWHELQLYNDIGALGYIEDGEPYLLHPFTGSSDGWERFTLNLDHFLDEGADEVTLAFMLLSDHFNNMSGWYIDDVRLYTISEGNPVTSLAGSRSPAKLTTAGLESAFTFQERLARHKENIVWTDSWSLPSEGFTLEVQPRSEAIRLQGGNGYYLPVEATLTVVESGATAVSNAADGTFSFNHLSNPSTGLNLLIEAPGYHTLEVPFISGSTTGLDLGGLILETNSSITGFIMGPGEEPGDNLPLEAELTVLESGLSAYSDPADGSFVFNHLHTGGKEMTLQIEVPGYNIVEQSFTLDEMETLDLGHIILDPSAYGDLNGDGLVNVEDVILAMRHILGLIQLEASQIVLADVDGDGNVNVSDVVLIMQYVLRMIESFPVED